MTDLGQVTGGKLQGYRTGIIHQVKESAEDLDLTEESEGTGSLGYSLKPIYAHQVALHPVGGEVLCVCVCQFL